MYNKLHSFAFAAVIFLFLAASTAGCSKPDGNPAPAEMKPVTATKEEVPSRDIRRMAERSGVKIKLRMNKDRTYSYEISGEDVDAIVAADRSLREYMDGAEKSGR